MDSILFTIFCEGIIMRFGLSMRLPIFPQFSFRRALSWATSLRLRFDCSGYIPTMNGIEFEIPFSVIRQRLRSPAIAFSSIVISTSKVSAMGSPDILRK